MITAGSWVGFFCCCCFVFFFAFAPHESKSTVEEFSFISLLSCHLEVCTMGMHTQRINFKHQQQRGVCIIYFEISSHLKVRACYFENPITSQ